MNRNLPLAAFLFPMFILSCRKEASHENRKQSAGDALPETVYVVYEFHAITNDQVRVYLDTLDEYRFVYDNSKRVTSVVQRAMDKDSCTGCTTTLDYFYKSGDKQPWLVTTSYSRSSLPTDSVFYSYEDGFVKMDSLVKPDYTRTFRHTRTGTNHYSIDLTDQSAGSSRSFNYSATAIFDGNNLRSSIVESNSGLYPRYFEASYLSSPNPFYGIIPRYPTAMSNNPHFELFPAHPNLFAICRDNESADAPWVNEYSYVFREDGYPEKITLNDGDEIHSLVISYRN